jgi:hypothetical protein
MTTDRRLDARSRARLASAMAGTSREFAAASRGLGLGIGDTCTVARMTEIYLTLSNLADRNADELTRLAEHWRAVADYQDAGGDMSGGDTPSRPSITAARLAAIKGDGKW